MDALSAIATVQSLIELTIKVGKALTQFIEAVQGAREHVANLVIELSHNQNLYNLLLDTLTMLRDAGLEKGTELTIRPLKRHADTMNEVIKLTENLLDGAVKLSLVQKMQWAKEQPKFQALLEKLKPEQSEVFQIIMVVNVQCSLRTKAVVETLLKQALQKPQIKPAFRDIKIPISLSPNVEQSEWPSASPKRLLRTWLGHTCAEHLPLDYVELRKRVSDSAYYGKWKTLFQLLDIGRDKYGECWANSTKLASTTEEIDKRHAWTPLHQAVYFTAPTQIVHQLLARGALRTLRTRITKFTHKDLTALDLAKCYLATSLYQVLTPVLQSPLPSRVLDALETSFHSLIMDHDGEFVTKASMQLPWLESLMELEDDPMWFPIMPGEGRGWLYQLDGRDLVVQRLQQQEAERGRNWRISQDGIMEVEGDLFVRESAV